MHAAYLPRTLPNALRGLIALALDLRWTWFHGHDRLWHRVDAELWEATANPWLMLQKISDQRLDELANDAEFVRDLQEKIAAQQEHLADATWFSRTHANTFPGSIAYFSLEFGVSESLPIYSGGLGILAGDTLKAASDLGIPLIGIGLLYQQGYFRQGLSADGEQLEFYPYNDPTMLPLTPLRDDRGEWINIDVDLPGRTLHLRTWQVTIGRCSLLLLDSNDPLNAPGDRGITSELYGGGSDLRLRQEIVLGIGGWRLLEKLRLNCSVCHLNEGHAAFAILERARFFMAQHDCSFQTALCATRAGNLFTSHTPVNAGFDQFPAELFDSYFRDYAARLNIGVSDLLALGRADARQTDASFNMAFLAVRGAGAVNGVSQLHGETSRRVFQPLFPRWPHHEVPIGHVANGVHTPSWDSIAADRLWTQACGKARWRGALETLQENIFQLDDDALWHLRAANRQHLVEFVHERIARQNCGRGARDMDAETCGGLLDANVLTLGFARRFTEYKRPNLLLHDRERLLRLLCDRDHPVQLVIAGKAHPNDAIGKQLLREWHEFLQHPELKSRAVFIEDYDLNVAAHLVQGVDVWINTPRRPWEACGTSGMKVLVNGGLNLSELDGWWAHAYRPDAGWAIGNGCNETNAAVTDANEALQLYQLLETDIVPGFYQRDEHGMPRAWIARIRASMTHYTTEYSSNRMVREYMDRYYAPLAAAYNKRCSNNSADAIAQWQQQLHQHWQRIYFGNVSWRDDGEQHHCSAPIYFGPLSADWLRVELFADGSDTEPAHCIALTRGAALQDAQNAFLYSATIDTTRPVADYTLRIVPAHPSVSVPLEENHILWHR
jgi:starch phosphorylase